MANSERERSTENATYTLPGGIRLTESTALEGGRVIARGYLADRNGTRLFCTMWKREEDPADSADIGWTYYSNGKPIAGDDGKQVLLYDESGLPMQAFTEEEDGRLVAWSEERMQEVKKQYSVVKDAMETIVDGAKRGLSKPEFEKVLDDELEKVKEAAAK